MCLAPLTMWIGDKGDKHPVQVACHECWQCREQAVNDWVGRNIAESKTAAATRSVTLTYGRDLANSPDHERAVVLTYSDVQKYIKLLRFHGFPVRYFITGEFGGLKGRAHWHGILHFEGPVPEHKLRVDRVQGLWSHGFSYWDDVGPGSLRYVCKYIQKDMGDDLRQGHLAMSKKPPLGAKYFAALAERYAQQGIAPQGAGDHSESPMGVAIGGFEYRFPEARRRDGTPTVFVLRDRSLELFLEHFVATWRELYGEKPVPSSPLVEEFVAPGAHKVRAPGQVPFDEMKYGRPDKRRRGRQKFDDLLDWQIAWEWQQKGKRWISE